MKINCDYCGGQIDTDKYDTCPNCGAGFDRDREMLKEKEKLDKADELLLKQKELENERLRLENENMRRQNVVSDKDKVKQAVKFGCALPLIIFGIFFVIMMVCIITDDETGNGREAEAATQPASRITGSFTISIDPISIPEIPEIPEVPEINIVPDIPDITTLPPINTDTAAAE